MDPALIPALYDAMTVARTGSVARAARRLNKTPSAVSQQIRRLSDALGVTLFERRGRGVQLTAAAERVLPAATRLFDEAEAMFRLFGELSGSGTTTLRIAASDYFGKPLLIPVLRELAAQAVPIHFEISTVHSEDALVLLERGEVEIALVSHSGERAGLSSRRLFEQPFFWIGPKKEGHHTLVDRLASEPLLRLAAGSFGRKLLDSYLETQRIRPVSTIDVPSVSLLLAYATGGVGVGLIPGLPLLEGHLSNAVVQPAAVSASPVQLVMRAGRPVVPAVEKFIERLVAQAGQCRQQMRTLRARKR